MTLKIPKHFLYVLAGAAAIALAFRWGAGRPSAPPAPPAAAETGRVRDIAVTAKQFEFSPNPITVQLGETIRLQLTSEDVTHGFSLPEFGINEILEPGKTVPVEFQATKKGKFPFSCSVACGSGHAEMRGTLVVE